MLHFFKLERSLTSLDAVATTVTHRKSQMVLEGFYFNYLK